jgi:hypothetical protein
MFLLLIFLALIFIATNNLSPSLVETFGFGPWIVSTIGPDTNRRGFEIESELSSSGIEDRGGCGMGNGYCAVGGGDAGAHLRKYPHYCLND